MRHRVPFGRALRQSDRARQAADRAQLQAPGARTRAQTAYLRHSPPSAPYAIAGAGAGGLSPLVGCTAAPAAAGDDPTGPTDPAAPRPRPHTRAHRGLG